ncbi:protein KARS-1, isoform c, partial [Piptocephalis cylindrospora]
GRITAMRQSGSKLYFYDLTQNGTRIQVMGSQGSLEGLEEGQNGVKLFREAHRALGRGDMVEMTGRVGKTESGELTIFLIHPPRLLAPCLHDIPYRTGLKDTEQRFRNRHVDLLLNTHARRALIIRAKVLRGIRRFLDDRDFLEVETPILFPTAGGANARPFLTEAVAYGGMGLSLRIAPELHLKQLVIGGLDRVYELGRQFRNEGVDTEHNPEFTTCEFYRAYTSIDELMDLTEEMLSTLAKEIREDMGSSSSSNSTEEMEIPRFDRPFPRIHVIQALEQAIQVPLPSLEEGNETQAIEQLTRVAHAHNIALPHPPTLPRILDTLIGHFVEPQCVQPTFLYGHPVIMSPLAKQATMDGVSSRFELFVRGVELVNAYEELNDPAEQRRRFHTQDQDRVGGDKEIPEPDEAFCDALEYGLPPTGGWGLGVDRLCAMFAGTKNMRETLSFPLMKPRTEG